MAQLGLDQFLNSLQSGGEYVQTSEFTLNTLKAREKLSQYQLADTGLWLVKLLQAAVVIGSPEVQIKFGKRQVTVQFENSRNYRAGALLQHVLSGEIPSDRALWHLITGLRASATFSSELVRWSCGRERASLDGSGSVVERVQEHPYFLVECSRPSRQRSLKKALTSSVYHLAKETVEEHDAVRSRCWASPIPVFLDGQELDRGYGVVSAGKIEESPWEVLMKHERSRSSKVTAVLAVGGIAAENSERARLPGSPLFDPAVEPILNKPVCKGETFLCYPDSGEGSGAVVVISAGHDSPTCIDYLLDGAMVCREPLENQLPETKVLGITVSQKPTVGVRFLI
ncbi:MAG: hypothetical protein KC800_31025, partial [Candidatus Eremiobacteraeota bacterium]|nr:hypothetical protein [Candidatus Eremiobacteraeota bacterium]